MAEERKTIWDKMGSLTKEATSWASDEDEELPPGEGLSIGAGDSTIGAEVIPAVWHLRNALLAMKVMN